MNVEEKTVSVWAEKKHWIFVTSLVTWIVVSDVVDGCIASQVYYNHKRVEVLKNNLVNRYESQTIFWLFKKAATDA